MSGRKPAHGLTRQHAAALTEIQAALRAGTLGAVDPLTLGVLDDLTERVGAHAKTAALIRVRAKNLGTPPSEKKRQAARAALVRARAKKFGYAAPEWTPEENGLFRHLWAETDTPAEEIAERFGRTLTAARTHAMELGVRRCPGFAARTTTLGRARAVIAKRRAAEARARREVEFGD
jgi:hypothetical protein